MVGKIIPTEQLAAIEQSARTYSRSNVKTLERLYKGNEWMLDQVNIQTLEVLVDQAKILKCVRAH